MEYVPASRFLMVKLPSRSVAAPFAVPVIPTLAPIIVSPFSASTIVPEICPLF